LVEKRLLVNRTFLLETTSIIPLDIELGFQIMGVGKSFTVYAENQDQKIEWITILRDTIAKHKSNFRGSTLSQAAAIWIPDDEVSDCMQCNKAFSILRRRHHCRKCGSIICAECSKTKAIIPGVDKAKEVRICDYCKLFGPQ